MVPSMTFRIPCRILPLAAASLLYFLQGSLPAAEPSVADLIRSSKSGDETARIKALDQLAAQGQKAAEAVAPLTQLLLDPSAAVRAHAANALGAIGAPAKPAAEA